MPDLTVGHPLIPPSSSDAIYKKELRAEVEKIIAMQEPFLTSRYGTNGWRLVIQRYLECTQ